MSGKAELVETGKAFLTNEESKRLKACESEIERGGQMIYQALVTIHDGKLYREFGTFEDYARDRWGMSRRHANRLIAHGRVLDSLTHDDDLMTKMGPIGSHLSERVTREVSDLEPEKQRSVIREVVNSGQKPTAKAVREAREKVAPKEPSARQQVKDYFKDRGPKASSGKSSIVLDQIGRPVPEHLLDKQRTAPLFAALARKLSAILKEGGEIADGPGSEHFDFTGFQEGVKRLQGELRDAAYWSACPRCDGNGCGRCKSTGFLPQKMKGMLSADDKDKLGVN